MNGDLNTILEAFAAWEYEHLWAAFEGETLTTWAHMPTQEDIAEGLVHPPFTMHLVPEGAYEMRSNGTDAIEDSATAMFYTFVVLTLQQDEMAAQQEEAIRIARAYREGLLLHRNLLGVLPAPNDSALISNDLASLPMPWQFNMFDVFGLQVGGLRIPITVRTGRYTVDAAP